MRIIAAFFIFLMMGCEAENTEPTIVGTWNWAITQGGIAGITIKPSENNQKKMIFDSKGNFSMIENGKTTVSAKYELINGKSITSTELKQLITFQNDDAMKMSYVIKGDSLFLFEEVYDGFGHTYVRAK